MADPYQGYAGFLQPNDANGDYDATSFVVTRLMNRLATTALVQVKAVTTAGAVAAVGFVDVAPMVNQVDGIGDPQPHDTIYNLPYVRIQGGGNAVILDPVIGDIGLAVFCSRDISTVKRTKAIGNPGSRRTFDWADGLYIGGVLNGIPTQYVQFNSSGITVKSPQTITLTGNSIVLNGATTVNGNVGTTGSLTNNGHAVGSTHEHTGVTTGTGISGPPQ